MLKRRWRRVKAKLLDVNETLAAPPFRPSASRHFKSLAVCIDPGVHMPQVQSMMMPQAQSSTMMMPQAQSSIMMPPQPERLLAAAPPPERVMLAPRRATAAPVTYVYDSTPQQYMPAPRQMMAAPMMAQPEPVRDLNVIITPNGTVVLS